MDVNKIETGLVDSSTTLEDSGAVKEYVNNLEDPAAVSQLWRGQYPLLGANRELIPTWSIRDDILSLVNK